MPNSLRIRRGTRATLPTLAAGEPGWTTDTFEIYVGDGAVNRPALPATAEIDIASAATTAIGGVNSGNVRITGTTTITSFGTIAAGVARIVRFAGALTLTHNATSLILPGGVNITTAAGDTLEALSLGAGNWVVRDYMRASGQPLAGGATIASTAEAQAGTNNTNMITPLRMREGFNAGGSAPVYACRAWVNFNGTGTVAIRASGNVSSITDNGVGDYTINFTTAMGDENYSAVVTCAAPDTSSFICNTSDLAAPTAAALRIKTESHTTTQTDVPIVGVAVFR